jgi:hypothetical protein
MKINVLNIFVITEIVIKILYFRRMRYVKKINLILIK